MKLKILQIIFAFLLVISCNQAKESKDGGTGSKLSEIIERGQLRVATDFNSTSYFIYKGQPMGYQYEMLQELADHLGVKLDVVANNNITEKFEMLQSNQIDLIAVNLTVTNERKELVDFTIPHTQTRQVLVQRRPENWQKMSKGSLEDQMLRNQLDLAQKTVYVQNNSTYANRLENLSEEIGDSIFVVEVDEGVEDLIQKVADGKIDYTICDENVALVNQSYFPNIDIETPVSFPQNLAWAVNKNSDDLRDAINSWLTEYKKTRRFGFLYKKYYNNKQSAEIIESEFFTLTTGSLSPYDVEVKKYSSEIGWDWRLLSSLMYQESRFNPEARSWAGAFGLMQLMPRTGERFGVTQASSSKQQIKAGIEFIKWLNRQFDYIEDPVEKQKFVLASYNIGPGHVFDAQKLAEKYGKNPHVWEDNVAEFLLKKSKPEYYQDAVVKHGYCRGTETYNYVAQIFTRFEHYKNLVE